MAATDFGSESPSVTELLVALSQHARSGDQEQAVAVIEALGERVYPIEGADDPVWPAVLNASLRLGGYAYVNGIGAILEDRTASVLDLVTLNNRPSLRFLLEIAAGLLNSLWGLVDDESSFDLELLENVLGSSPAQPVDAELLNMVKTLMGMAGHEAAQESVAGMVNKEISSLCAGGAE